MGRRKANDLETEVLKSKILNIKEKKKLSMNSEDLYDLNVPENDCKLCFEEFCTKEDVELHMKEFCLVACGVTFEDLPYSENCTKKRKMNEKF